MAAGLQFDGVSRGIVFKAGLITAEQKPFSSSYEKCVQGVHGEGRFGSGISRGALPYDTARSGTARPCAFVDSWQLPRATATTLCVCRDGL